MERFARVVLGYHGCPAGASADFGRQLLSGESEVKDRRPSSNEYDWLGDGIYSWEYSPERAREWAGADGLVGGAVIQLGNCLDLLDMKFPQLLSQQFDDLNRLFQSRGQNLPRNEGIDLKLRKLDRLVINELVASMRRIDNPQEPAAKVQTVRGAFDEGAEVFPGSLIKLQTHIQIAVLDVDCILGVFRPNFRGITGATS